jgi:DNA-binding NarL/FixJ family response regulator
MPVNGTECGLDGRGTLRVAIVSPREVVRRGLHAMLMDGAGNTSLVSSAADGRSVGLFDVLIYDLALLETSGTTELTRLLSGSGVVVGIEVVGRPDLVQHALSLGMSSSLAQDVSTAGLHDQLLQAARGHVISAETHRAAMHAEVVRKYGLTEREATVLALVAVGMSNAEIAEHLYLSINSIKTYIRQAYGRIGARSRSEAVLWAIRHGLSQPSPQPAVSGPGGDRSTPSSPRMARR